MNDKTPRGTNEPPDPDGHHEPDATDPPGEPNEQDHTQRLDLEATQHIDTHHLKESSMDQRLLGGRYEVGELLGRGGMAEVYSGRDTRLGRVVAIKTLRVDLARDPSFQHRFRREAQAAASLNHPNIVAIYDTGEEADPAHGGLKIPYIVMESVEGTTLRNLLNNGRRLMPERALEITSGVLAALEYSHRAGIVHRDIKPANVMLTPEGKVKVMDFGIARAVADPASTMTQTGATLGTAQYLSPEQAQGGVVDPRSDIYSTGCMLYELLTGRPPFTGDSPVSVAYQHVRENPVPPSQVDPNVSPTIDAIVMKSLAKNADNRYQSAAEMREDIERALGGRPVAATPVMDETRAINTIATEDITPDDGNRGRRIGFVLLGLAVLGLIVGGIFALMSLGGGAKQVTVPDLVGLKVPAAQEALEAKGLVLGDTKSQASDQPANTIIAQDPLPPASIAEGSAVNVTVSLGPKETTVPNVKGFSLDQAVAALNQAKLVVSNERKSRNSSQPINTVLDVEPKVGTKVPEGSSVVLVLSTGNVKVPDVVGLDEAEARATLTNAGFEPSSRAQLTSNEDQVGKVLAQQPSSGSLKAGSVVIIEIGTARPVVEPTPEPTTEPSVEPSDEPTATATGTPPADD